MIGQALASKRPDLIAGAILCNTSAKIGTAERWNERIDAVQSKGVSVIADAILENWFGRAYLAKKDKLALHKNMLGRTSDHGYVAACKAIRDADLSNFAKQISVPVLCIGGDEDKSVPPSDLSALAELIPNAQAKIFKGLGHIPSLEMPIELAKTIETFADEALPFVNLGNKTRRQVLGDAHVDAAERHKTEFDAAFQRLITQGAWAEVWGSAGLSARDRSLLTLALLAALGNVEEIPMHIRASKRTGATLSDITEAFQHVAIYAGVPKANHAIKLAKQTFNEMEKQ